MTSPRGRRELSGLPAEELAARLALTPHPEGGFFRETYRATDRVSVGAGSGTRPLATSVLYLLTASSPSHFHRLRSDELWFYHAGASAELVLLPPFEATDPPGGAVDPPGGAADPRRGEREPERRAVGPDSPQTLVPAGWWMAAYPLDGDVPPVIPGRAAGSPLVTAPGSERTGGQAGNPAGDCRWTLVSCMVVPGFEYDDFELGDREALLRKFPRARDVILSLT